MNLWEAAFLGTLQGLTEFLPVSSSGHLCLAQHLLGVDVSLAISFDVALHLASLLAILAVFRGQLRTVIMQDRKVLIYVALSALPAAAVVLFWRDDLKWLFFQPWAVGLALMVTGGFLVAGDFQDEERLELKQTGFLNSLLVGLAQSLAIVPGISRSGSTIVSGLACGMKRSAALEFSFLMAIPAILGAACIELPQLAQSAEIPLASIAVGMTLSFVFSVAGLLLLKKVLASKKLKWFGFYCFLAGAGALFLF